MSSLSQFFFGQPGRFEQQPTGTPGQQNLIQQLIAGLSGGGFGGGPLGMGLENISQILSGDPEAFEAFAAPARRAFQEKTLPAIGERFTGALGAPGAESAQRSSAFAQTLGQAGAGLEESLSAQKAGLQSQALQQLMGFFGQAQAPQFQTQEIPGQPGFLQSLLAALGGIGGQALSGGIGGLIGGQGFRAGAGQGLGVR